MCKAIEQESIRCHHIGDLMSGLLPVPIGKHEHTTSMFFKLKNRSNDEAAQF